jgi:non-heme chloroperoxidase
MPAITTKDGTQIYYNADSLQGLGKRTASRFQSRLASVRRRMGRPDDLSWRKRIPLHRTRPERARPVGSNLGWRRPGPYADDLAELVAALDLHDAVHVGHSTGGGEVARYIGRHGTGRVSKAVLISAIPPLMLKTPANPAGTPIEVFDGLRASVLADRQQFCKDLSLTFFGFNRPGAAVSEGLRDSFWL